MHLNLGIAILLNTTVYKCLAADVSVTKRWSCDESDRCVPYVGQKPLDLASVYETRNICRLSCGKYGSLWPQPTGATIISHGRVNFNPKNIHFDLYAPSLEAAKYVEDAEQIFMKNIWKECKGDCNYSGTNRVVVQIRVATDNLNLDWNTDESSVLVVTTVGGETYVDVQAPTVYGARHALESLSQLITTAGDVTVCPNENVPVRNGTVLINYSVDIVIRDIRQGITTTRKRSCFRSGLVIVSSARVVDKPVYSHRGLLIDTARHFISVKSIKRTLDAMATSKLNVFHWHATDSQSFPLEIPQVPQLQRFGAYSADSVYSKEDIELVIKYARQRGIRVLIEIDSPSHAGNGWQWGPLGGLGDLAICINQQPWRSFCIQPPCGQMNPVNENLYSTLRLIYEDIAKLLPKEETMHLGGDEVFIPCWNSSTEILNKLRERGMDLSTNSFHQLWSEFHQRTQKIWTDIKQKESKVILWTSGLTESDQVLSHLPPEKFIIQTWVPSSQNNLVHDLLAKGYQVIVSTKDAWYFDHGFWGKTNYYGWRQVYDNRISGDAGVLGGEVCMWSEYVDENSLDTRVWPRAGAAAERLWADPRTSAAVSENRFNRYRERLIARGIEPDAVTPKWCELNEGECR